MPDTDPTDRTIGMSVRALRKRGDLLQGDVVRQMPGWVGSTLSRVEAGLRSLKASEIIPLARALEVAPMDILNGATAQFAIQMEVERIECELVGLKMEQNRLKGLLTS